MMMNNRENIEALIVLYLKGEATPEQAMELEDWRKSSEHNDKLFLNMEHVFSITHQQDRFKTPEIEEAWTQVLKRTSNAGKVITLWKRTPFYYAAAAVVLLALVFSIFWNTISHSTGQMAAELSTPEAPETNNNTMVAADGLASFTLSDQSKVTLQPNSKIILAENFNKGGRNLTLEGSGSFEVVHDESNPFVIEVEGLKVVDLGTIFHIKNKLDTVKVVVDEGEVALELNGETLDMVAGDSAFYAISDQVIAKYKKPRTRKNKVFEFDGTTLSEVAAILSEFYERKIVIKDKAIEECPVSVTFKNEELATILDIVKELLDVKIVQNKDIIEIYGNECN